MASYTDTVVYYVTGTGCDWRDRERESAYYINLFSEWKNSPNGKSVPKSNIRFKCHKTTSSLQNIVSAYIHRENRDAGVLKSSKFVKEMATEIEGLLLDPEINDVIVFGLSFGGAIVNRVAELISDRAVTDQNLLSKLPKLKIVGLGSIYIPPKDTQKHINVLNYVSITDVAILCNKIKPMKFSDMPIQLVQSSGHIICAMPTRDNQSPDSTVKQICLYKREGNANVPFCSEEHKISIRRWNEHNYYTTYLLPAIFANFLWYKSDKFTGNVIDIYDCANSAYFVKEPADTESIASSGSAGGKKRRTRGKRRSLHRRQKSRRKH
jgi:hypothetical protein